MAGVAEHISFTAPYSGHVCQRPGLAPQNWHTHCGAPLRACGIVQARLWTPYDLGAAIALPESSASPFVRIVQAAVKPI